MTDDRHGDFAERVTRSWRERYGLALLLTAGAFAITLALLAVSEKPIYAPLIGAIAITAWLGVPVLLLIWLVSRARTARVQGSPSQ